MVAAPADACGGGGIDLRQPGEERRDGARGAEFIGGEGEVAWRRGNGEVAASPAAARDWRRRR